MKLMVKVKTLSFNCLCHMAELVFQSLLKITHADCLLNGPRFYNVGSVQYAFYFKPVGFGGKMFQRFE